MFNEKLKENILKEFYRTELKPGEDVIDNRSITIAKLLGVEKVTVDYILSEHLNERERKFNEKINKNR